MEIGILRFLIMLFSSVGEEIGLCLGLRSICLGMEMLAIWTLYRMDKAESMPFPAYNEGLTLAVKFLAIVYATCLHTASTSTTHSGAMAAFDLFHLLCLGLSQGQGEQYC